MSPYFTRFFIYFYLKKLELEKSIDILSENKLLKSDVENLRLVNFEKSENFEKFRDTISKQNRLLNELNVRFFFFL